MGYRSGEPSVEIHDIEGFMAFLLGVRSPAANYRFVLRRDPCVYCGHLRRRMTVDHIEPRALGGRNSWMNLAADCYDCNASKKTEDLLSFLHGL